VRGRTLTVANIGDSRVILGRASHGDAGSGAGKLKAVEVSVDHKPDREDEMKRIVAHGGRVFAVEYDDGVDGPPRVWLGHMDIPGLAMARSLGDTVAHTAGVISDPEMHSVTLTSDDKVMVWASDGLWEFMSNQEVSERGGGGGRWEGEGGNQALRRTAR
jgi:serine/threonine protein phosphatase PrpC